MIEESIAEIQGLLCTYGTLLWRCRITWSVGLEQSSTGRTKVAVVLSCYEKGNKLALKLSAARRQHHRPLTNNPETIPITINIPMLQARMPRFAQGHLT